MTIKTIQVALPSLFVCAMGYASPSYHLEAGKAPTDVNVTTLADVMQSGVILADDSESSRSSIDTSKPVTASADDQSAGPAVGDGSYGTSSSSDVAPVPITTDATGPEPASFMLLGLGIAGLIGLNLRRKPAVIS